MAHRQTASAATRITARPMIAWLTPSPHLDDRLRDRRIERPAWGQLCVAEGSRGEERARWLGADRGAPRVGFDTVSIMTLRDGKIAEYREVANSRIGLLEISFAPERVAKILVKDAKRVKARPRKRHEAWSSIPLYASPMSGVSRGTALLGVSTSIHPVWRGSRLAEMSDVLCKRFSVKVDLRLRASGERQLVALLVELLKPIETITAVSHRLAWPAPAGRPWLGLFSALGSFHYRDDAHHFINNVRSSLNF